MMESVRRSAARMPTAEALRFAATERVAARRGTLRADRVTPAVPRTVTVEEAKFATTEPVLAPALPAVDRVAEEAVDRVVAAAAAAVAAEWRRKRRWPLMVRWR